MTRAFFEIVDFFFSKNLGNIVEKAQNCVKSEHIANKMLFIEVLLLKILEQIFKIFTFVVILVTLSSAASFCFHLKLFTFLQKPQNFRILLLLGTHQDSQIFS